MKKGFIPVAGESHQDVFKISHEKEMVEDKLGNFRK